jgi:hypothetical protein
MRRHLRHRLHALLLLTLFLGSGTGLPALDELLYHSGRDTDPALGLAHLDPPHGCGAHSEHCVLAAVSAVRQLAPVHHTVFRFEVYSRDEAPLPLVSAARSFDRSLLQPSRAPPASAS